MYDLDDTIAAISTPPGSGGIAVIRISGKRALEIADGMFQGKTRLSQAASHKACLGRIVSQEGSDSDSAAGSNHTLDEAVVTVFRAPHSYTTEDVVEISCHGGQFLSHRILELVLTRGARLAQPGEFTQRAFLNGRLDLSQAEAVADLISARTEASLHAALSQYQGALSAKVHKMRQDLLDICSLLELELDFAEEDVEFASRAEVAQRLQDIRQQIDSFLATYARGKILREGARLVILGKPNVGKSSLLNALLKEDRAIVTEIPGTTRDVLEEQLDINGVYFRVIDTAGIRQTTDIVEHEGVQRSYRQIKDADIVLVLFDASGPLDEDDRQLVQEIKKAVKVTGKSTVISVLNKCDLNQVATKETLDAIFPGQLTLEISAKELTGFDNLERALVQAAIGRECISAAEPMLSNLRQKQALQSALDALDRTRASLQDGLSGEFVAVDLREALSKLGEIIGEVTTEDILGNIFSRFCIGK